MLTSHQKALVKSTIPVLKENGVILTSHFYERMFTHNSELKQIFNQSHQKTGKQPKALASAVLAYAENIDDPAVLEQALVHIAHKHVSLNIRAEHYAIVGKHLIASIKEVLGDAASEELLDAWKAAYSQLAQILIDMEFGLYQKQVDQDSWTGWRSFKIVQKVPESDQITSFYLKPVDNGKLPMFYPGQYVSIRIYIPEWNLTQPRQYTLSDAPGKDTYRISVKREDAEDINLQGKVSTSLHHVYQEGDTLDLSAPTGEFFLKDTLEDKGTKQQPVFLISAGVGITPMISMLTYLSERQKNRNVYFLHGAENGRKHIMRDQVNNMIDQQDSCQKTIFYSSPASDDIAGIHYDYAGRMDLARLNPAIFTKEADYYICGPMEFMQSQGDFLRKQGISSEKIHIEAFGTGMVSL